MTDANAALSRARARLGARQTALAEYLADPEVERAFRLAPELEAEARGVPLAYARWLATIEPERVAAFRRTQAKKRSEAGPGERAAP